MQQKMTISQKGLISFIYFNKFLIYSHMLNPGIRELTVASN